MVNIKQVLEDFEYLELGYENVEVIRVSKKYINGLFLSNVNKEYSYIKDINGEGKVDEINTVDSLTLVLDISQLEVDYAKEGDTKHLQEMYNEFSELENKLTSKSKLILSTEDDIGVLKRVVSDLDMSNLCDISFIFKGNEDEVKSGKVIKEEDKLTMCLPYNEGMAKEHSRDYVNSNIKSYLEEKGNKLRIEVSLFN